MAASTIELERECGVWLVTLRGEHDLLTAPRLQTSLAKCFLGGWTVIVDLSDAEFIDSTILHVLIGARRQRHSLALVAPSSSVAGRLAELVWLADAIPTYQTRDEALDLLVPHEQLTGGELRLAPVARLPSGSISTDADARRTEQPLGSRYPSTAPSSCSRPPRSYGASQWEMNSMRLPSGSRK